jgi:hypothetical protein
MSASLSSQQFNNGSTITRVGAMPMSTKFEGPASLDNDPTPAASKDQSR